MPSTFLLTFALAVVRDLEAADQIALTDGPEAVAAFVADRLAERPFGSSLISSLSGALIACPGVDELFADDDALKRIVGDLPPTALPR